MKKTATAVAVAVAVAVAGFATVAQAAPQDDTWYVGGKLGWSKYYNMGLSDDPLVKIDRVDGLGAGAFLGYQVNPYLGFEIGYDWLGSSKFESRNQNQNAKFTAHGVQLAAKLSYPMTNEFDIYTRLGGMVWRAETKVSGIGLSGKETETGVSPLAAIGVEYAINRDWATRLDYQFTHKVGDEDKLGLSPNNGFLSVGVVYRFGQEPAVVTPAMTMPAPTPAPVMETKHYTLTSDVLFDYNKSNLKEEGKKELDSLYQRLVTLDPNEGSAVVIGYSDRIGTEHYNQKLSEARAHNVANYLISKGFPESKISYHGMGKNNPVTGNSCDNIKLRSTLINCLGPDRRVEIEIKGAKEETTSSKS